MNKLFPNMPIYESILVIMGVILFLALVFVLIWSVMKKRSVTTLLPFFLLPVIMVAYPTIKSIKIGDMVIAKAEEVENLTEEVVQDPTDTTRVVQLKQKMAELKITKGAARNGKALLAIANAQMTLGKYDSASLYLEKAHSVSPGMSRIDSSKQVLTHKIKLREDFSRNISILNSQIEQLKGAGDNSSSARAITSTLKTIQYPDYIHPNEAVTLAKSYAIAGDQQQSLKIISKLDASAPDQGSAVERLKDSIRNNTYQKQFFPQSKPPKYTLPDALRNKQILIPVTTH